MFLAVECRFNRSDVSYEFNKYDGDHIVLFNAVSTNSYSYDSDFPADGFSHFYYADDIFF